MQIMKIVPILTKIDLPAADCDRVAEQIEDVIGIDASGAIQVSAKTGVGIHETLEAIVQQLPAPIGNPEAPLKAMLVDSWYDSYLGVIVLIRVIDGHLKKGEKVRFLSNNTVHHVDRIGVFRPQMDMVDSLGPGEIGFLNCNQLNKSETQGSAIPSPTSAKRLNHFPGFKPAQPVVFCGLFPVDSAEFEESPRSYRQVSAKRCLFYFRDGNLCCPWFWLPLWLSWTSTP